MARKIIIDTDPGIDDAMAIFYALKSPELDVIGLTTVFGNSYVDICTDNALRLLEIAGRTDIPVAKGAENPIAGPFRGPTDFVHGADSQGESNLPPPVTSAVNESAAEFIIRQVMSAPGEITLVPIGPLANLALALRLEPAIAKNVREVVMMGGNALVPGNASPEAEANILDDPEAADVVFSTDWQVTMVGLDVTHQVEMSAEHLDSFAKLDDPMAQHAARILPYYRRFYKNVMDMNAIFVHDSSAISYLLYPELFKTEKWAIKVQTQGAKRGKTLPLINDASEVSAWQGRRKMNICVDVDGDEVVRRELHRWHGEPQE